MAHISKTILEVMNNIKDQEYILPDIQRGYVWKTEQIENLFDSLLRGYPIGSFLFWNVKANKIKEYNFYNFVRDYHPKQINSSKLTPAGNKGFIAILDGQQRLTSLYIGLYGSYTERKKGAKHSNPDPFVKKYLYLNLLYNPKNEEYNINKYEFEFLSDKEFNNKIFDNNNLWIKVNEILEKDVTHFLIHNKNIKNLDENLQENVISIINNFQSKIKKEPIINYYEENDQDLDKVLDIFVRVNSGGTQLSYSDLLMSTVSATWDNKNAREEVENLVLEINNLDFNINKDFIMKSSLMLTDIDIKFQIKNFTKNNMIKIEKEWDNIKRYLLLSFKILKNFGYTKEYITSYNSILPIAYYLKLINADDNFLNSKKDISKKIIQWFRISLIRQVFGGSSDGTLTKYREIIKNNSTNNFPIKEIEKEFKGKREDISFDRGEVIELIDNANYSDRKQLFSILSSAINIPNINELITIDHLYPKSSFNENNIYKWKLDKNEVDKLVNNISNLQFLGITENTKKSAENFENWLNEKVKINKDYKSYALIPDIDYKPENFILFCQNRKKLMVESLCKNLDIK
ncbi:DUF262 domain-containing protein [Brachyspira aalborgi]|jgi:uncharacterized protein with ParB-like and HNH nuclease domain|uniref:DUF262 domain-containing protein n=1 Tax=Brachyspira aalborgi TaxID=29522 RepID=A0AB38PY49_9SPIR|nr:DUF262 domain-containing protein [Brachyspira aalborgi]MBS4763982.1 DUF262 domain-containing protein [Brachyspira sp.]TXJ15130.1 DUF262 domain-containing protein [Brachyspira aalborgi]TXJ18233.1 DUF262 domain-containing protein [Brachyspira aalborgi]TXJ24189.1 DUF262 domain-containing protein [Brachyspira aalborgi]TXJ31896.1 DUF262 domain-containing protein [Brachyspira aalborgi]